MDPTGYTQRQAEKNKKLLEEILQQLSSLKTQVSEIRLEIAKLSQVENKIKNGENIAARSEGGWFIWS